MEIIKVVAAPVLRLRRVRQTRILNPAAIRGADRMHLIKMGKVAVLRAHRHHRTQITKVVKAAVTLAVPRVLQIKTIKAAAAPVQRHLQMQTTKILNPEALQAVDRMHRMETIKAEVTPEHRLHRMEIMRPAKADPTPVDLPLHRIKVEMSITERAVIMAHLAVLLAITFAQKKVLPAIPKIARNSIDASIMVKADSRNTTSHALRAPFGMMKFRAVIIRAV